LAARGDSRRLASSGALMGASLYEESVLDLVWPRKPSIVRAIEGSTYRKLFGVPADIIASTSLWSRLRRLGPPPVLAMLLLAAVGLYAINIAVSVVHFVQSC
jgi:hypothetical protein